MTEIMIQILAGYGKAGLGSISFAFKIDGPRGQGRIDT